MTNKLKSYAFEMISFVAFLIVASILVIRILHLNTDLHMQVSISSLFFIMTTLIEMIIAILLIYALPLWFVLEIATIKDLNIEKPEICHKGYVISTYKIRYRTKLNYQLTCVVRCWFVYLFVNKNKYTKGVNKWLKKQKRSLKSPLFLCCWF